ncbi:hypothetical protein F383_21478 [Gossypium arboreum]|uniref:Uncharacterized protein n=1 Tax=Gossypium arboreum TaxID=29729 RepID=A0A0B0P3P5_GOSAR|nr:hypothetical protein F383_21478 [Gossypium arboreum]
MVITLFLRGFCNTLNPT